MYLQKGLLKKWKGWGVLEGKFNEKMEGLGVLEISQMRKWNGKECSNEKMERLGVLEGKFNEVLERLDVLEGKFN